MDKNILRKLTYGLYIISSKLNNENVGCVVNTVTQITSNNPIISISINKDNYTNSIIKKSKKLAIMVLSQNIDKEIISKFGFYSGKDINKFTSGEYELINDLPIIKNGICGYLIGDVINIIDVETHDIFLIRVKETQMINEDKPLTYEYYQKNMKGTSPKNAPTYLAKEIENTDSAKYRCVICGHIYDDAQEPVKFVDLPDDWRCPVCGVTKDKFEKIK